MGMLFGARLRRSGVDVAILHRTASDVAYVEEHGVHVEDADGSWQVRVPISTDARALGDADLVIVFTKAYDTEAGTRNALPCALPSAAFLTLQNGLGNWQKIAGIVGAERVLAGATSQGATRVRPGHVRHAGQGPTQLGCPAGALAQRAGEAAALLTRAGIPTEVVQDVEAVVWSKLVLSAAINPLTVLAAGPNGDLVAKAPLRRLLNAVAREAAEVARGRAIRLLWSDPADEAAAVCQRTRDNVSSMLQDVLAGRRTEIDEINGALCSEARRVGVPVPLNEALTRLVREGLASGGEPSAAHCGG